MDIVAYYLLAHTTCCSYRISDTLCNEVDAACTGKGLNKILALQDKNSREHDSARGTVVELDDDKEESLNEGQIYNNKLYK